MTSAPAFDDLDGAVDLPIIAAHAGSGAPSMAMARIVATTPNVHLELASSFASLPEVRAVVDLAGPDRILFGSDAPLLDPSFVLGTYADTGLLPATHPAVFRGTAARLFGVAS